MRHSIRSLPFSVFIDETKLDINYVPSSLPHRERQLQFLAQFFRFAVERPGKMSQRVLITGSIGTGKTVLCQSFGRNITKEAREKGINLNYVHVNCRECKGSFFQILQRVILNFYPRFPRRGYSAEELLHMLMEVLDEKNAYLILALDELDALIRTADSEPLYDLTRVHESRMQASQRLSLICILRKPEYLESLDPSTRSTLQRNLIHLEDYSPSQLRDILSDRVAVAFRHGAVSDETLDFVAESASSEVGGARYAIELLWRAGKYADASESPVVLAEHVRKASTSIYPTVRRDTISSLGVHEKLFLLGVARRFKQAENAYLTMGEAEDAYAVICEEHNKKPRGHTQIWKYIKELAALGIIKTEISGVGRRGKTTIISLPNVPASDLENELNKVLHVRRR